MPYVTPLKTRAGSAIALDSGDFPGVSAARARRHRLRRLSERARRDARAEGRYLGIGIGNGMKGTGRGPFESGIVRIGRSGRISVYTGAMPMGQGIKTALAQICAEQFGVSPDMVTVVAGDTAVIPHGQGGFASRQTVTAGSAVHLAAVAVREKALAVAAHLLEASPRTSRCATAASRSPACRAAASRCATLAEAVSGVPGYAMPGNFEPGLESMQNFMPSALTYGAAAATRSRSRSTSRPAACASCAMSWSTTAAG